MVNKAIILGNLGRDPELRHTQSGQSVCSFSVATTERWKDKDGNKQEKTEWHNIVVWGKQGEMCAQYLKKGRQAFIEGRLQTRSYDDKDGNRRYVTEIVADNVRFIGTVAGKSEGSAGADDSQAPAVDTDEIRF